MDQLLSSFDLINGFTPDELAWLSVKGWQFAWVALAVVVSRLLGTSL